MSLIRHHGPRVPLDFNFIYINSGWQLCLCFWFSTNTSKPTKIWRKKIWNCLSQLNSRRALLLYCSVFAEEYRRLIINDRLLSILFNRGTSESTQSLFSSRKINYRTGVKQHHNWKHVCTEYSGWCFLWLHSIVFNVKEQEAVVYLMSTCIFCFFRCDFDISLKYFIVFTLCVIFYSHVLI